MSSILIIEDEKDIVEALEYNLKREGFGISRSFDGYNGLRTAKDKLPDLILLDLMLPGIGGLEIIKILKQEEKTRAIPIIILTARGEEADRVLGLELGADDYIAKPFSMRELVARVKAVLKRTGKKPEAAPSRIRSSDLEIDLEKHQITVSGKAIEFTAKEFALLAFLAGRREKVFSRERLLDEVWGIDQQIETRTVDVHIRRLREKLGKAGSHLQTLRGVGYKYV